MSRLATSFVLGYHGCDKRVADRAVTGDTKILQSTRDFDWLGPGAYFWESDPKRAREWAEWKVSRGEYTASAVVGAVIDTRHCLDLLNRDDVDLLAYAYKSFCELREASGLALPKNRSPASQPNEDLVLRCLDCAVIKHLHSIVESPPSRVPPYDTVRGLFTEGESVYPGSGVKNRNHIQIAVRNPACILGIFLPLVSN